MPRRGDAATAAVRAAVTGDQAKAEEARERAAQAMAKAQNVPVEQARTKRIRAAVPRDGRQRETQSD
jgi:hypothetical protein